MSPIRIQKDSIALLLFILLLQSCRMQLNVSEEELPNQAASSSIPVLVLKSVPSSVNHSGAPFAAAPSVLASRVSHPTTHSNSSSNTYYSVPDEALALILVNLKMYPEPTFRQKHDELVFGKQAWEYYFDEIGIEPTLPLNINTILDTSCPFWHGKKIRDTHLLMLIPAKVNGKHFSLNLLEMLIRHPQNNGYKAQYRHYDRHIRQKIGGYAPLQSYWILMTRDILPNSSDKCYQEQQKLVDNHANSTSLPYKLPNALEAATTILMHHVRKGEYLFSNAPRTYTRCKEWVGYADNKCLPTTVGGSYFAGLDIDYDFHFSRSDDLGTACCLRLCTF
jgi:hypothetical protein